MKFNIKNSLRRFLYSLSLLVSLLPFMHAAPPMPDGTIPSNVGVQLKGPDMNAEALDRVKAAGFTWVRRGFIWEGIEKEKGVYDFTTYDNFIALCKERGLKIIAPLCFGNKLYGHPQKEPARSAYAAWAAALAARYKDEPIYWELWNEPNTMTFWNRGRDKDEKPVKGNSELYAEEYYNMCAAAIPAMKKADPQCIILAGSVSNMWTESYKWMGFVFADGMLKLDWDSWSVHPYGLKAPEDYIEAYKITRGLMDKEGGSKKPWINSERGFPVDKKKEGFAGGEEGKLYEYQAWHLVRQYMIDLLEGLPITIWYEWSGKEGFALSKEGTHEETPALKACKVMIQELNGYKIAKRLPTQNDRDFVLEMTNAAGNTKLVAWTSPPAMKGPNETVDHPIVVPVSASGELEVSDIYGVKSKLPVKAGGVEVMLTGSPVYITVK